MLLAFWIFVLLALVTVISTAHSIHEWTHGRMAGRWIFVNLAMLIVSWKIVYWVFDVIKQQDYLLR